MQTVRISNVVVKPEHSVTVPEGFIAVLTTGPDWDSWPQYRVFRAGESFEAQELWMYYLLEDEESVQVERVETDKGGGKQFFRKITDLVENLGGEPKVHRRQTGSWGEYGDD